MFRSSPRTTTYVHRILLTLPVLLIVLAGLSQSQSQFATQAKQRVVATPVQAAPISDNAVFLELAKTVGQARAAERLIDYKRKVDPASQPRYLAIVDFSQRSTSKRLYVFDTVEKKVDAYYVAHGRGSEGPSDDGIAENFSNVDGSFSSSLGVYRTLDDYNGHHGHSLRLQGLEPTNSNALDRAVVLHTADYVSENFIKQTGRLGRSEGCFAVERSVGDLLINELKNGAYIIAWKG
jgi:hypothetical protein